LKEEKNTLPRPADVRDEKEWKEKRVERKRHNVSVAGVKEKKKKREKTKKGCSAIAVGARDEIDEK